MTCGNTSCSFLDGSRPRRISSAIAKQQPWRVASSRVSALISSCTVGRVCNSHDSGNAPRLHFTVQCRRVVFPHRVGHRVTLAESPSDLQYAVENFTASCGWQPPCHTTKAPSC